MLCKGLSEQYFCKLDTIYSEPTSSATGVLQQAGRQEVSKRFHTTDSNITMLALEYFYNSANVL